MRKNKVRAKDALQFFEDNFCMISSLEAKSEDGCAEKCLAILKHHIHNIKQNKPEVSDVE